MRWRTWWSPEWTLQFSFQQPDVPWCQGRNIHSETTTRWRRCGFYQGMPIKSTFSSNFTNVSGEFMHLKHSRNIFFTEVKDFLNIPRDCGRMRDIYACIKHLENLQQFGVLYRVECTVTTGAPHGQKILETRSRICAATSEHGDLLRWRSGGRFTLLCMALEVSSRFLETVAIAVLLRMPGVLLLTQWK